jgi:membrane-associated phospholipid phosphatase
MENETKNPLNLNNSHELTKKEIIVNLIIAAIILVVGGIFYLTGFNEKFYSDNETVRDLFALITDLGKDQTFIVFVLIIYLAYDKKYARKLVFCFLVVVFITVLMKELIQDPRPTWNIVDGVVIEDSFGFPSGHTSFTLGFWLYIILSLQDHPKKKPIQIIAILIMIIVPISRLIIGVHDLGDIIGGAILGILTVLSYMLIEPKANSLRNKPKGARIGIYLILTVLLWIGSVGLLYAIHPDEIAKAAEEIGAPCGLLVGCSISFVLEEEYIKYNPHQLSAGQKILAIIIGMIITFGVYFGLSMLFEDLGGQFILRGLRYMFVAIALSVVTPFVLTKVFKKTKKSETE